MKTFKFSLVLRTHENTDVFITLDDNIYGIHRNRVNILYLFVLENICYMYGVQLVIRRLRVRLQTGSATFFRGDLIMKCSPQSLPSADSRRAVVSFWQKNVHNTG